jgi:hypothetical protein
MYGAPSCDWLQKSKQMLYSPMYPLMTFLFLVGSGLNLVVHQGLVKEE